MPSLTSIVRGDVDELVVELAGWMAPDDVEREVARHFPWLDEDRRAAAWLLARAVRERE